MAIYKKISKRHNIVTSPHPRKKGNLFAIDANAVSEAREFGSSFSTLNLGSDSDSERQTFFYDTFRELASSSTRPGSLTSSMKHSRDGSRKRSRHSVSFAESIETVHEVDNLKLCLSKDEKKKLWGEPEKPSAKLTRLEQSLYDAFIAGDEPLPMLGQAARKDNKRRRRKSQSKLRHQNHSQNQYNTTNLSPQVRSVLTSRLAQRQRDSIQSAIPLPFRE